MTEPAEPSAPPTDTPPLVWERIELSQSSGDHVFHGVPGNARFVLTQRARVPGGWLVRTQLIRVLAGVRPVDQPWVGGVGVGAGVGLTFVPDPGHEWKVAIV